MKKKTEGRAQIRFSAAKFKRLPMAEKLVYLRKAFSALGYGLRVEDVPRAPVRPVVRMLSKAQFDRLTIEKKLAYLSRAHRELWQAASKIQDPGADPDPEPDSTADPANPRC